METQICAIPAKCSKCGGVFDLSYDLEASGEDRLLDAMKIAAYLSRKKALLCWECRMRK